MFNRIRSQLDKIIITAMDRFVWFVLLVVMSHLVTEFTRVTGYARGNRHDVVLINDTSVRPMPVASMIFYPGEEYGLYDQQISQYNNIYPNNINKYNSNSNYNNYNNYNNNPNIQPARPATNAETVNIGFPFSFRPLIDSIFEIPISTLRAVNNLVGRLTGSYQHQVSSMTPGMLKSTNVNENSDALQAFRSLPAGVEPPPTVTNSAAAIAKENDENTSSNSNSYHSNNNNNRGGNPVIRMRRRTLLREVNA